MEDRGWVPPEVIEIEPPDNLNASGKLFSHRAAYRSMHKVWKAA